MKTFEVNLINSNREKEFIFWIHKPFCRSMDTMIKKIEELVKGKRIEEKEDWVIKKIKRID